MAKVYEEASEEGGTRIIGIVSGKGGVGKSTLAVNIGSMLTKLGKKCIIIDADLSNPSVSLHLGLSYTQMGLQDVLAGKTRVSDAIIIQPTTGIRIIPASLRYRPKTYMKNLKHMLRDLAGYDYVIIDSPPGLTEDLTNIIGTCTSVVIVTTPDIPGIASATKLASLCRENGWRVEGVVANRVTRAYYELSAKEIESTTGVPVLCEVPEDPVIPTSIAARVPAVVYSPTSPASQKLRDVSLMLSGEKPIQHSEGGFLNWFLSLFRNLRF